MQDKDAGGRLRGRKAIVTGGARGIGRAYVERFLAEGADVAIVDLDAEVAARTAAELSGAGVVFALPADVADEAAAGAAVEEAAVRLGGLDIVVNNAAIVVGTTTPYDPSLEYLRRMIEVNMLSAWLVTRAAAPHLVASAHGRVVNVASTAAFNHVNPAPDENVFPGRRGFAYSLAKHGIVGLTKFAAGQLGHWGVTVNAIAPGPTHTDVLVREMEPEHLARIVAQQPIKGALQPADMAGVAVYFASDDARFVTGQVIVVDGGRFMPA
ncbi:MAG: SDR family NAD(P)-dependent oxidoreductase [Microbacterium sp.]